jgi:hypothetical protein
MRRPNHAALQHGSFTGFREKTQTVPIRRKSVAVADYGNPWLLPKFFVNLALETVVSGSGSSSQTGALRLRTACSLGNLYQ